MSNRGGAVGRTPWSARVPLDPLLAQCARRIRGPTGVKTPPGSFVPAAQQVFVAERSPQSPRA